MSAIVSRDITEQGELRRVRRVVEELARGVAAPALRDMYHLSRRALRHTLTAARVLGWTEGTIVTPAGLELLRTDRGSADEEAWIRESIDASHTLGILAPDLLDYGGPDTDELAARIAEMTCLSRTRSRRGAESLVRWKEQATIRPRYKATARRVTLLPVPFEIDFADTRPGDTVMLLGDHPTLGAWDPSEALPMNGMFYPTWHKVVRLPKGETVEFKFGTLRADGAFEWHEGDNQRLTVPA